MITNWQDPQTSEIRSTHISGLQDAVGKIEDILEVQLEAETGVTLTEVYISDTDRYRIYQAPLGKRNWAASPAPVIYKNGVQITSGFTIDYGGGAIILSPAATSTDVFTADFSRVKTDGGNRLDKHLTDAINVKAFGASGSDQTTTGDITAGSAVLTLASAIDFKNGQGITVNHAGAACTLATPGAPTVTPTGTAGTTAYEYQIVALDGNGGCTAASAAGATSTGNATLDATNYNALSWTAVTDATGYAVYGRVSGTMQLLAIVSGTTWNDKGTAAITPPSTLPSSPPASALADTLVTTIVSGGGTTTLTLATTATTTATAQVVGHDDTAAIQAAIDYIKSLGGGILIIPAPFIFLVGTLLLENISNIRITGGGKLRLTGQNVYGFKPSGTVDNIEIDHLEIYGDGTVTSAQAGMGNASGQTITNIKIYHNIIHDVTIGISVNADLSGTIKDIFIEDNKIYNIKGTDPGYGYGIHISQGSNAAINGHIKHNTIDSAERHSIYVARGCGIEVMGNHIKNHRITQAAISDIRAALNIARCKNVVVKYNIIEDSYNAHFCCGPDTLGSGFALENINISDNIFLNLNNTIPATMNSIYLGEISDPSTTEPISNIEFCNNIIYANSQATGFIINYYGKNISIHDNFILSKNQVSSKFAFVIHGSGDGSGTASYSNNISIKNNKIYSDGALIGFRFNSSATSTIKILLENNDIITTGSLYSSSVAITNPNITIIGQPTIGLSFAAGVLPARQNIPQISCDSIKTNNSAYNAYPIILGSYYLWVDASGRLRIKSSAPTSESDGIIVGTQV